MTFGPLVTTQWLGVHLGDPGVKIIDGSWRMPGGGDAEEHYREEHIPGAVFFDIDAIADKTTDLPHMLPTPEHFEQAVGALGISQDDVVVIYDEKGVFSAARVWWTFRVMGHEKVAVLDGGLPQWLREQRPVNAEQLLPVQTVYRANPRPALCASASDVRSALSGGIAILDARPADRFAGAAPEPRPGLRSGHMPGAVNLPFSDVLAAAGLLKSRAELRSLFESVGVETTSRVITSCGSGVTAAVLSLALEVAGFRTHAVYDGSWSEWGDERHDNAVFPVVADAAGR